MKKLTILLMSVLVASAAISQNCQPSGRNSDEPTITAAVVIDYSMKPLGASGFMGFGVQAGIWADHIGLFGGLVESKLNENTPAVRETAVTIAARYQFFEKKIQAVPFFTVGTNNYQDYGLRVGYKLNDGIYGGVSASRMIHYGVTVMISVFSSNR